MFDFGNVKGAELSHSSWQFMTTRNEKNQSLPRICLFIKYALNLNNFRRKKNCEIIWDFYRLDEMRRSVLLWSFFTKKSFMQEILNETFWYQKIDKIGAEQWKTKPWNCCEIPRFIKTGDSRSSQTQSKEQHLLYQNYQNIQQFNVLSDWRTNNCRNNAFFLFIIERVSILIVLVFLNNNKRWMYSLWRS